MKKHISLLIIALCAITQLSRAELVYQHFSVEDGLSQNTVMSILQDHKGFMWFGTWDGLNKFDGYQFTTYKSTTNNRVDFIYEDQMHYIWFQTYDGLLHRFDTKTEHLYTLPIKARKLTSDITCKNHFVEVAPGEIWIDAGDSVVHVSGEEPQIKVHTLRGSVNFICLDADSNLWVGTNQGLFEIHADEVKDYPDLAYFDVVAADAANRAIWFGTYEGVLFRKTYDKVGLERFTLTNNPQITDVKAIGDRQIIATTANEGFYLLDHTQHQITIFSTETDKQIKSDYFKSVTIDSYGMAWLENEVNGIYLFNPANNVLNYLKNTPDPKYAHNIGANLIIFEDKCGKVWVNPQGGGFGYYDKETNSLVSLPEVTNVIHTAFVDNEGAMWLSTYAKGIERIENVKSPFRFLDLDDEVRSLRQLSNGMILAGTKDGRTHLFNGISESTLLPDNYLIYSIHEDKEGHIWLGTRGDGVIVYDKLNGKVIKHFTHDPFDPNSISSNDIYDIVEDVNGNIYIGTYGGGINILSYNWDQFISATNQLIDYPMERFGKVRSLMIDSAGILWIGSTNGLAQMKTGNLEADYNCPIYSDVHSIVQDSKGTVWIGTFGGGLNRVTKTNRSNFDFDVETFTTEDGMFSDIVLSIAEDHSGNLWLTSENAITRYDTTNRTFQNFSIFSGNSKASFSESNALQTKDGEMLLGCTDGICVFTPNRILHSNEAPQIEFTRFQLFNKDVEVGTEDSPLKESIYEADKIVLNHDQSVFSIEYAALDFSGTNIQYAFILDGFEKQWNYVEDQRKATYTNLPQGTYTFRVKSTNAEGVWVNNEHDITIVVKPSFWQTPWAIMIYILIIAGLLYLAYILVKRYNIMRQNIAIEQKVTDIKLRFFTNISHELRTPLTLISGPVENILTNEFISQSVRDQLEIVKSNSDRMLRLINQILDFRKIQNKKLRLKVQLTDIEELVRKTCANFNKEAIDKHIDFSIQNNLKEKTEIWLDRDKTDIILYNLLSNAFKFTPSGKAITVIIDETKDYVTFAVKDEGVGIEQNKLSALFERFTSNNEINNNLNIVGTGIGLNLVKELVDLHHGYIDVKSEVNKGSTFTVMLRRGKDHFEGDADFIVDDKHVESLKENMVIGNAKIIDSVDNPTVLVVEDNDDMRSFLTEILSDKFHVEVATDGEDGVQKAREISPVLIISDVMMPNKDGLELVNELKQDINTSHIPIILLTAKTAIDSRLEAMKYGADDYITKPFSPVYLSARVDNILEQRKRLQESYRQNLMNLNPQTDNRTSPDEIFLAKLMNIMDKNIDNSELTVDGLLSDMAMGRTVFYNKLKGLTGFSPVEFIREVRIKRAAQLLETGQYSITEITYMVGMNDARYFSKCFKAVFGVTPSEYKRNMQK